MKLKTFYLEQYPTDDLGIEIDADATFRGLFDVLDKHTDVYEYIGVGDSLIRQRIFEKLAEIYGLTYDDVYTNWITNIN